MTPEEILEYQWQEFESEAKSTAKMLHDFDAVNSSYWLQLKNLWDTRGGDTASYESHQEQLNNIIAAVVAMPAPWTLDY